MSDEITIWHNPRCSKSRGALGILRDRGLEPHVVEYLETPPSADEVLDIARRLGVPVHDMVRADEDEYAALGLSRSTPDEELARAIAAHPVLLQRPIVVRGERGVIARPPERVEEILR